MLGLQLFFVLLLLAVAVAPLVPMRRRNGQTPFPAITILLLIVNVYVFAITTNDGALTREMAARWGLTPRAGSVVTLFTYMFLHGGSGHLLGNLLGLWLFGPHVEEALGRVEYVLFYVGCGVAAGLLHVVFAATVLPGAVGVPLVGASGAIFGVLGLFAVRFWRAKIRVLLVAQIPAAGALGLFAALQVFWGMRSLADGGRSDSTANWAHVGGFVFGAVLAAWLRMRDEGKREYRWEDAQTATASGRPEQALAHYRRIVADHPGDARAHADLARVCVHLRQAEAAHRHFGEALRLFLGARDAAAATAVYESALQSFETFPLPPALLQRVASAAQETGQWTLAQRVLSELCRDPDGREAELALLQLGKLHLHKLNQPQNALGIFSEFVRLYPDSEWRHHAGQLRIEAQNAAETGQAPAK